MYIFNDKKFLSIISIFLIIILFLAVNITSNKIFSTAQIDLTYDKLFTVSDATKDILLSLDEPIILKFYKSREVKSIPALTSYAERVEEFLEYYQTLSSGKIFLEIHEPDQFSVQEDEAVGYGIQAIPISGAGNVIYFGLAGTNSTDDEDIIPLFSPSREVFLEYDISKLIYNLSNPKKTKVSFISSLPISADPKKNYEPWISYSQAQQFFDLRNIGGNIEEIDESTDILLLVQPKNLSETTLYAIDQYILKGGKLIIFLDPHVEISPPEQNQTISKKNNLDRNSLESLFNVWGIDLSFQKIVGDRSFAQRVAAVSGSRRVVTEYLPWLSITEEGINRENVITSDIERINITSSSYIKISDEANLDILPLIYSSKQSQLIDIDNVKQNPNPVKILSEYVPSNNSFVLSARITGKAKSAFQEGPPDQTTDQNFKGPNPELVKNHLIESNKPFTIILTADVDMLADQIWMRSRGNNVSVPTAQNGDFFVNSLDYLAGSSGLIALRGKGLSNRPFELVNSIRKESELKYRSKERSLLQNLENTQEKISNLKKEDQGKFILSPEQKSTIDNFQREMVKTRAELRLVQHDLQSEIKALDARLKFINIGLIPLAICIFGIFFLLFKRSLYIKKMNKNSLNYVNLGDK
ncbi:Gldg family protein [Alphaproteobacteria bacterium]|nr:Gldg family protein [Alphaproteobacteria bacterium]